MNRRNQHPEVKPGRERRAKTGPTSVEELSHSPDDLARLPTGPGATAICESLQAQAVRLDDGELQGAQRRALAAQIGLRQGNQHLQAVVASSTYAEPSAPFYVGSTLARSRLAVIDTA